MPILAPYRELSQQTEYLYSYVNIIAPYTTVIKPLILKTWPNLKKSSFDCWAPRCVMDGKFVTQCDRLFGAQPLYSKYEQNGGGWMGQCITNI